MKHMFLSDVCDGPVFEQDVEDYNEVVDQFTIVTAFCGEEVAFLDNSWTYQHQFTTCEECKGAYALSLLADLP